MFQPSKGHFHGVGTVAHMHTSITSVHIQCKVIYLGTDVRDIRFMPQKLNVESVCRFIFFGQKYGDWVSMVIKIH